MPEYSLSLIVPEHEELPITISELDYFLSKRRYRSFEFVLVEGPGEIKLDSMSKGFGDFVPDVKVCGWHDLEELIEGEKLIFVDPDFEFRFEDFEDLISFSKEKDGGLIFENSGHWFHRILESITSWVRRVLGVEEEMTGTPKAVYVSRGVFFEGTDPHSLFEIHFSELEFELKRKEEKKLDFWGLRRYLKVWWELAKIASFKFYKKLRLISARLRKKLTSLRD